MREFSDAMHEAVKDLVRATDYDRGLQMTTTRKELWAAADELVRLYMEESGEDFDPTPWEAEVK